MGVLRRILIAACLVPGLPPQTASGLQTTESPAAPPAAAGPQDSGKPPAAQTAAPVWRLQAGDSFEVLSQLTRRTLISFPDQEPVPLETTDEQLLRYTAETVSTAGDVVFVVEVRGARRSVSGQASRSWKASVGDLQKLKDFRLRLQVDPEGRTTLLPGDNYSNSLQKLASGDDSYAKFLQVAIPQELLAAWFERPFWLPRRDMVQPDMAEFTVNFLENAGPFGLLRCDAVLKLQTQPAKPDSSDQTPVTTLQITGSPRYVQLPLNAAAVSPAEKLSLPLKDLKINSASLTGSVLPAKRSASVRPPFDRILTQLSAQGTISLPQSSAASDGQSELPFELQQIHQIQVTGFSFAENLREQLLRPPVLPAEPQ